MHLLNSSDVIPGITPGAWAGISIGITAFVVIIIIIACCCICRRRQQQLEQQKGVLTYYPTQGKPVFSF